VKYGHPLEIPRSRAWKGLRWQGERAECPMEGIHGDTHPMTWAADDGVYMSAGDPNFAYFNGKPRHVPWPEAFDKPGLYPHMGGLDVEKLAGFGRDFGVEQVNTMPGLMGPGGNGPKPSGMISVKGALYLAAQTLLGHKPARHREKCQHGSDASIMRSDDLGKTWSPDIQSVFTGLEAKFYDRKGWKWTNPPEDRGSWMGWKPMFPGPLFGGPSFVQFGKDNSDAVDSYVYAVSSDQWDNGTELRLGRVPADSILEAGAWEWAVPDGNGGVSWTGMLEESGPVLGMDGHLGLPEMVYLPSAGRYLLLTWGLHKDFHVSDGSELTILESENPWGPFSLVYYEKIWDSVEVCPYCPRVPMKWFDQGRLSGWLLHSGSWHTVNFYKPHVKPFQLVPA